MEILVSKKSLGFTFRKFSLGKKVSVSENLVSEKSFGYGNVGLKKSLDFGFRKLGLGKKS